MPSLVFDIETLAFPLSNFDEKQQEYLVKFAKTDEEREQKILEMALSPLTARVVCIGMINPDNNKGKVVYVAEEPGSFKSEDGMLEYLAVTSEKEVLIDFWDVIKRYNQVITFNGRSFDCPFVIMRSGIHNIKPTKNLMPYRYDTKIHCDLLEQLTFYGATRKYNLDFICKSFGIKSPKEGGVTGLDLAPMFEKKMFREIADYCIGDVIATAELFRRWRDFMNTENG